MSEENPALSGPAEEVGPWTIKTIGTAVRDAAVHHARREKLTTGQWVERQLWAAINAQPPGRALVAADAQRIAGTAALLVELIDAAVRLSELPDATKNERLIKTATRTLRSALIAMRGAA